MDRSKGSGSSEAMLIMGIAAYILFMGYLGIATEYTSQLLGSPGDWSSLPLIHTSRGGLVGWIEHFYTGTLDVFIVIINLLSWILQMLLSYVVMIGYSSWHGLPVWVTAVLFVPVSLAMGWLVLSLVRGRE